MITNISTVGNREAMSDKKKVNNSRGLTTTSELNYGVPNGQGRTLSHVSSGAISSTRAYGENDIYHK